MLKKQATRDRVLERVGAPSLSVQGRAPTAGETTEAVVAALLSPIQSDWHGVTTAGQIYQCGLSIRQTFEFPHHSVLVNTLDDEQLECFAALFRPARRTP